jgi:hypothetical protein
MGVENSGGKHLGTQCSNAHCLCVSNRALFYPHSLPNLLERASDAVIRILAVSANF